MPEIETIDNSRCKRHEEEQRALEQRVQSLEAALKEQKEELTQLLKRLGV